MGASLHCALLHPRHYLTLWNVIPTTPLRHRDYYRSLLTWDRKQGYRGVKYLVCSWKEWTWDSGPSPLAGPPCSSVAAAAFVPVPPTPGGKIPEGRDPSWPHQCVLSTWNRSCGTLCARDLLKKWTKAKRRASRSFQKKELEELGLGRNRETHIADSRDGSFVLDSGRHASLFLVLSKSLAWPMPYFPRCYKYGSLCQAPSMQQSLSVQQLLWWRGRKRGKGRQCGRKKENGNKVYVMKSTIYMHRCVVLSTINRYINLKQTTS